MLVVGVVWVFLTELKKSEGGRGTSELNNLRFRQAFSWLKCDICLFGLCQWCRESSVTSSSTTPCLPSPILCRIALAIWLIELKGEYSKEHDVHLAAKAGGIQF